MDSVDRHKYRQWLLGIIVSIMLTFSGIANVWAVIVFNQYQEQRKDMLNKIEQIERNTITKSDMDDINCKILEKIDARFDKFELYFQTKYKITPK